MYQDIPNNTFNFNENPNSQNNYDPYNIMQNGFTNNTTNMNNNTPTNNATTNKSIRIKIENVLFEYVHLTQPHAFSLNETPKYSVTLLIPKQNNQYDNNTNQYYARIRQKVRNAISEAYNIATQTIWNNIPQIDLQTLESKIIRDGDTTDKTNLHGHYYIKVTRDRTRTVTAVDNNNQEIQDKQKALEYLRQIQNGDGGIAYLAIKGYSINNNQEIKQGIGVYLDAIRKTHNKAANYSSTAINPYSFNPSDYL